MKMTLNDILTPKLKSILIRATKTFAQTMASMIAVGLGFEDVDWIRIISVSGVAFLLSILTNIGGTPESTYDGKMIFTADADGDPSMRLMSDLALTDVLASGKTSMNMQIVDETKDA